MSKPHINIQYTQLSHLPSLAWVARVQKEGKAFRVIHGRLVEAHQDFFFEGAWSGSFDPQDFSRNSLVFGSGGVFTEKRITFVAPTCTTDYLYWCDRNGNIEISNSLPLLLAYIDDRLDVACSDYSNINQSIILGIKKYERTIPTQKGAVNRLIHANLIVEHGRVLEEAKSRPNRFLCFQDYSDYLREGYGRIAKIARHPDRVRPLSIYSTQSRGYDSTAVNAIAKDFGVEKVFTISSPRDTGQKGKIDGREPLSDDGSEICANLGLTCEYINRLESESDFPEEYQFYATLHRRADANLLGAIRQMQAPSLLLTGVLGEIWYPREKTRQGTINDELVRWDLSGHGLTEVRLTTGFVQVAVPYIGARNREDILRITGSEEMMPWSMKNDYDRTIPRRIAEMAGVPRSLFGQHKMATTIIAPRPCMPINTLLQEEFFEYLLSEGHFQRWQIQGIPLVQQWNHWVTHPSQYKGIYYLERVMAKVSRSNFHFPKFWLSLESTLFCFCVNKRVGEFHEALKHVP